jgi:hypothetical protein
MLSKLSYPVKVAKTPISTRRSGFSNLKGFRVDSLSKAVNPKNHFPGH